MDHKEKLELLIKYDFSSWRNKAPQGWYNNKSDDELDEIWGFGDTIAGIYTTFKIVIYGKRPEEALKNIDIFYSFVRNCYNEIQFDELDQSDEDFRFFFNYWNHLNQLGGKLHNFRTAYERNVKLSEDSTEFKEVITVLDSLNNLDYRRDVLEKYGLHLPKNE